MEMNLHNRSLTFFIQTHACELKFEEKELSFKLWGVKTVNCEICWQKKIFWLDNYTRNIFIIEIVPYEVS